MSQNQYDNEGRFVIFPNTRKEEGSKQPDYTGEITIDGVKKRLSGWRNTSKSGMTYLAGQLSDFQENSDNGGGGNTAPQAQAASAQGNYNAPANSAPSVAPPSNDNIPF
jgi:hypothetical protein